MTKVAGAKRMSIVREAIYNHTRGMSVEDNAKGLAYWLKAHDAKLHKGE